MSTVAPLGLDVFKNELPEDELLMRLDTGLNNTIVTVFHDRVFDAIITRLTRSVSNGEGRVIALEVVEIDTLHFYAERIQRLVDRYAHAGRKIDVSFELGNSVRVQLNLEGLGYLDIRKFVAGADQAMLPTTYGVRIPIVELPDFCEKIAHARHFIFEQKEEIKNIVKKTQRAFIHQ
jgi:hypothetical protein